jgi:hypothetical protein
MAFGEGGRAVKAKLMALRDYLLVAPRLGWRGHLFVASDPRPAVLESRCAVIDLDEEDDPDNPPFAAQHGLEYVLTHGDVRQVIENVRLQLAGRPASPELLMRALGHYIRNDAFIDLAARQAEPGAAPDPARSIAFWDFVAHLCGPGR